VVHSRQRVEVEHGGRQERLPEVVFLVRHGETEWNRSGRRQGQRDSALTKVGRKQAQKNAELLLHKNVDALFSSPLGRALETADIIARVLSLEVIRVDSLLEISHGGLTGLTNEEVARYLARKGLSEPFSPDFRYRPPGGESYADAERRVTSALGVISEYGARRPCIVSHEMIGRVLIMQLLHLQEAQAMSVEQPHDVVLCVDVQKGDVCSLET
jgi:broad specificity phosphatase PhoE